ncbi:MULTISPECIES: 2-keto-4-pentenoate hydratase [unclassified Microbacterium]|uniref:2-keto-4-pentenoate hydratase n=1 Tax=unclassified Microbacterium TaxID=2609290 RepID=UPI00301702D7
MSNIDEAADRLEHAAATRTACEPVRDLLGADDIDLAYRVQQELTARRVGRGARRVGRKIGLTSPAVQQQIGVDRPDFGVLFDDMAFDDGATIGWDALIQPKAEAEVAFVLGADILDADDRAALRAGIRSVLPALEIVDSRVRDWAISITDTVADNASSGVFVLGSTPRSLAEIEPADVTMRMLRGLDEVSRGDGRACLGDPLNAVRWLARTAIEIGDPLRAGDIVLSGALGPMVPVQPGDTFTAHIEPLGTVTASFAR